MHTETITTERVLDVVDDITTEHDLLFGPVHYSGLRCFDKSAAHYREYVLNGRKATRPMNVGTIAHSIVLGPHTRRPLLVYPGAEPGARAKSKERNYKRQGDEWERWSSEQIAKYGAKGCTLVTKPEYDDAQRMADAVMRDPEARRLLEGTKREVALKWNDAGLACETDGIDFVGDCFIGDLKFTSSTNPEKLVDHVWRMHYHAQAAWAQRAAHANRMSTAGGVFLICCEMTAPYPVVCLRVTERSLVEGRKTIGLWTEALLNARRENHWPGYVQRVLDFDPPYETDEEGVEPEEADDVDD